MMATWEDTTQQNNKFCNSPLPKIPQHTWSIAFGFSWRQ